uniref:Putative gustatory receptor n=1 Tax=Reticulitermes speratus TaxID=60591 RepID=A0A0U5APM3_9NEOP
MTCLCVMRFFKYDRTFEETQCSVFYGCSFSRMLLFLLLARHWPALAHRWEQVESVLAHHGYPHHHHHHHKVNVIIAMFLSAAFIEHIFSHVRVIRLAVLCAIEDGMDGICTYFFNSFPHVYDYIPCSLWNGVIVFLINVLCAFAWTYMDLFIVLMSVALADKFRQLNRCLQSVQGKPTPPRFWHQMREDYNTLSCLVMRVDSCMSKIVFLSFANNLYTVCIQLFNSLHLPQNAVQMVYFCLSFGYVLLRIVAVSLSAASINEQSSQVRKILYSVPATSFSKEVQRFLQQVTTYEIALTGLNLFSVKRTLLLKVAATIVTYELILVQFSAIHADERDLTAHSVAKRYCL